MILSPILLIVKKCQLQTKPISRQDDVHSFISRHIAYVAAVSNACEPKSYRQVVLDERWRQVMNSEIEAQEENKTWTVEDLPPGKRAIGC